jgi:hypothetical protein
MLGFQPKTANTAQSNKSIVAATKILMISPWNSQEQTYWVDRLI